MKFFLAVPSKSERLDSDELANDFCKRSGSTLLTPRGLLINTIISLLSSPLSCYASIFLYLRGDGFKDIAWTKDALRKFSPIGSSLMAIPAPLSLGLRLWEEKC